MRTHYCKEDRDWITFEGVCSWCGLTEEQIDKPTSDEEFRQLIERMHKVSKPNITDD